MATTFQLKRSSVQGKQPNVADLLVGELAVNLADGILYSKNTAGNVIVVGSSTTSNITEGSNLYFTNNRVSVAISTQTLANATFSGEVIADILRSNQSSGDEGGQIELNAPQANTIISGRVAIDVYQNKLRIFETTGTNRGVFIDFGAAGAGVGSNLLISGGGGGAVDSVNGQTGTVVLTTANIAESGNLYYTDARVYANVELIGYASNSYVNSRLNTKANTADLTTANVAEVTNLYFTNSRVYSNVTTIGFAYSNDLNTSNVVEGANLYYTDARVYANVSNIGYALDADLTTANVSEVSNLYFTNARVYSNVTSIGFAYSNDLNTSNVIEGANLYYTDARVYANVSNIGYALDADLTTANVAEVSNLYFTNARVYANVELIGYASNSYVNTRLGTKANTADLTTANVSEVTNLYFTNTRSRQAISGGTGVNYDTSNGIISIGQSVGTTDDVTFSNVTVTGNLFVQGNAITFSSNTLIIQDPLIQVGVNPTGDTVDLGFFGHYLDSSVEKHAGLFRDATDGQFKLFSNLIAEPTTIVDTANASYQSANLVVNYIVGKITDISNHSTTNLSEGTNLYFTNTRAIEALTSGTGIVIEANGRIFSTVTGDVVSVNGLTGNVTLTTANIAESGNLYFTNTRAVGAFTSGTGIVVEANGRIFSTVTGDVVSVNGLTGNVTLTTANIAESGNLYFTNSRAIGAFTSGTGITIEANGRIFSTVTGGGGGASVTVSNTAPSSPNEGDLYWDEDLGRMFIYYNDGDSAQWVDASPNPLVFEELTTAGIPESGNLYYTAERVYANVTAIGFASNTYVNNRLNTKANTADLTTANVAELTNLYFTNTRSRNSLTQGLGVLYDAANGIIYANVTSVANQIGAISNAQLAAAINTANAVTTSNVLEGSNLYFTNTRAVSALTGGAGIVIAANGMILTNVVSGVSSVGGAQGAVSNASLLASVASLGSTGAGNLVFSNGATLDAPSFLSNIRVADGSATTPGITFANDTNTGLYRTTTDSIAVATNGTQRLTIDTAAVTSTLPWRGQDGTAGAPAISFSADNDNGLYRETTNVLGFAVGGSKLANLNSTGLYVLGSAIATEGVFGNLTINGAYTENVFTVANATSAYTVNLALGTIHDITLGVSCTVTMPATTNGRSFTLFVRQGGGGNKFITWNTVRWPANVAPSLATTNNRCDIFTFYCLGNKWFGVNGGNDYTPY